MRRFHSYGPVDGRRHFCVPRRELVDRCADQLVGDPAEGGHYFTVWAPRQTGKTWLVREVKRRISQAHGDRFVIGMMSMQGVILREKDPDQEMLSWLPDLMEKTFGVDMDGTGDWRQWIRMFRRKKGVFKKPVILFIDEFDSLPPVIIDRLAAVFRDMFLDRTRYALHGLALIGVRAVLGVDSPTGSPFNVQRSLNVPNFSEAEVQDLFDQYQGESGQAVAPDVVRGVYDATRGQPGLVCWLGELLTEKYNAAPEAPIDAAVWKMAYHKACHVEWNNTVLNLIKKAKTRYPQKVLELFSRQDMRFSLDADWCGYLYLNGVIESETAVREDGSIHEFCRFSSPFIQRRLYNALTEEFIGDRMPILPLAPLDDLSDVFTAQGIDAALLLDRYKDYLKRLRDRGVNPWKDQPRRADLHFTEAVGHFHLYAWLKQAAADFCTVSPEFPTGNGKVDLHLKWGDRTAVIEVKSFKSRAGVKKAAEQAAAYAGAAGLAEVALALFTPVEDKSVLEQLSTRETIGAISVTIVAIGWM